MGLLKILFITLILVFYPLGEITRITFGEAAVTFIDLTVSLIAIIWLFSKVLNKQKISGKLFKPILVFVSILIISLILNANKLNFTELLISSSYILRWVAYASIYFVVKDFDHNFKKGLPYFMILSGAFITVGGFIQYFFYPDLRNLYYLGWDEHLYRMFSSFLDPNFAGAFFVLYFLFVFVFFQNLKKKTNYKYILFIILIISFISILLTFSRSAYIMFIIGISLILVVKKQVRLLLFLLAIFSLSVFMLSKSVLKSEGTNLLRTQSGDARLISINNAITIFKDNPILGVGFNSYRYAQERYGFINEEKQLIHSAAGTDNSFLFILATTGIIGFSGFLYLLYKIISLVNLKIKKNYFSLILFASVISLLINSFFVNSLFFPQIMLWMWILIGLTEST